MKQEITTLIVIYALTCSICQSSYDQELLNIHSNIIQNAQSKKHIPEIKRALDTYTKAHKDYLHNIVTSDSANSSLNPKNIIQQLHNTMRKKQLKALREIEQKCRLNN